MKNEQMIAMVERYFKGVDLENFDEIVATLSPNCTFSVETHGVKLQGNEAIKMMFDRLWSNHKSVQHKDFSFVVDTDNQKISAQFSVVNLELDGSAVYKSNCNFFTIKDGKFNSVAVYMAGPNTLNTASR